MPGLNPQDDRRESRSESRDAQNRIWLCGQVMEVLAEHGMSTERALAMLHVITDPGKHEPYLADVCPSEARGYEPEAAATELDPMGFWEQRVGTGYGPAITWPPGELKDIVITGLDLEMAKGKEFFVLGDAAPLEDEARPCKYCGEPLVMRDKEGPKAFGGRDTCNKSCAGKLRHQRRREAREAVAA